MTITPSPNEVGVHNYEATSGLFRRTIVWKRLLFGKKIYYGQFKLRGGSAPIKRPIETLTGIKYVLIDEVPVRLGTL